MQNIVDLDGMIPASAVAVQALDVLDEVQRRQGSLVL